MEYVALDVGKRRLVCCVMNPDGSAEEEEGPYPSTLSDAARFAGYAVERYGECKAVVESAGNLWLEAYEAFEPKGVEVKPANPVKTRAVAEARVKTDRVDARALAHPLRAELIAGCYAPGREVGESRAVLSHRMNPTRELTRIKSRVHSLLDRYDLSCEYGDIFGVNGTGWLRSPGLNGRDQLLLQSLLRQVESLQEEVRVANSATARDAVGSRYAAVIMSMTGFDCYSASLLSAYVADVSRFPSPERLVSWAGLCPSVRQSGDSLHMGRMKGGSTRVRWIMVQAASAAVRSDTRMRAFYERKLKRHDHNAALTHVANRMLRVLWHMLREGRLYDERRERLYRSKLKRMMGVAA